MDSSNPITMILAAIIFVILGAMIKYGKMYFLIAGYNTMSAEKKAEYDIEGVANLFKNVMFFMAFIILIGYVLSLLLGQPMLETIFFYASMIIGLPYLLYKSNSDEFKLNKQA